MTRVPNRRGTGWRRAVLAAVLVPVTLAASLAITTPAQAANNAHQLRIGYGCAGAANAGWSVNDGWGSWNNPDTLCGGGSLWTFPNGATAHSRIKWWAQVPCDSFLLNLYLDIPSWDANYTQAHYTLTSQSGQIIYNLTIDQSRFAGDYGLATVSVQPCTTVTVTLDDLGPYAGPHVVIGGADVEFTFFAN